MALLTYPLNNIDYSAEDAEAWLSTRTSGVYAKDDFDYSVTASDTSITIGAGRAWIHNHERAGKVFVSDTPVTLDAGIVDNYLPRYDVVAIRFSTASNATDIVIKHGTPQSNPELPEISQTNTVYELYLYSIYRAPGTLYITSADISDLRISEYCGLMGSTVDKIDTSAIQKQVTALLSTLSSNSTKLLNDVETKVNQLESDLRQHAGEVQQTLEQRSAELIQELQKQIEDIKQGTDIMLKSTYDQNGDGLVDCTERIGDVPFMLVEGTHYGSELPTAGTAGRIFFLKVK